MLSNKIGFLSTYNQRCGLACYADYLLSRFNPSEYTVLAEDVPLTSLIGAESANVRRCWKRLSNDFSELGRAIEELNIGILHLNCHYSFFDCNALANFLSSYKAHGLRIVSEIHNPMALNPHLQALIGISDTVIVHSPENRLEVIANGASPERVQVVEHGVEVVKGRDKLSTRQQLGISSNEKMIVTYGFIRKHKGIDQVVHALTQLSQASDAHLYVVGNYHEEDPESVSYLEYLKGLAAQAGIFQQLHFVSEFSSRKKVQDYLIAADVVVLNYQTDWYEASGTLAESLGCGAAVVTSLAPPFARFTDTVFHATSGYPLALAIELVLSNDVLRKELQRAAITWAEKYSWENTADGIKEIYSSISHEAENDAGVVQSAKAAVSKKATLGSRKGLRVLMQNRVNTFTQRGGDTVVMERVADVLRAQGHQIDFDISGTVDLRDYDLVHLYNFAIKEETEKFARSCVAANKPFVVTTMYEDWPLFFNQMVQNFKVMHQYVNEGQPREKWEKLELSTRQVPPSSTWDNTWTANRAEVLIASGQNETKALRRDYPQLKRVGMYYPGANITNTSDNGDLFYRETGLSDFILCVGRLETRKNQLMLLKALEDSELTVVFAAGGFTYQPEYEELCRKFKRKGKTVFLERLEEKLLSSMFAAARVHVLPSWYELPGLVSLEAARVGTNVVVSDYGTARDYFDDFAYYCSPDSAASIFNATVAAFYAPAKPGLQERVADYTWENTAKGILEIYTNVLEETRGSTVPVKEVQKSLESIDSATMRVAEAGQTVANLPKELRTKHIESNVKKASLLCDEADRLSRSSQFQAADEKYQEAKSLVRDFVRAHRGSGVVALSTEKFAEAEQSFRAALALSRDSKSLTGLGASLLGQGKEEDAFQAFSSALDLEPTELSALFHLIQLSYRLKRLPSLEQYLRGFIQRQSDNTEIKYCLAGCLFQQGKYDFALGVLEDLLQLVPTHTASLELREAIQQKQRASISSRNISPAQESGNVSLTGSAQNIEITREEQTSIAKRVQLLEEAKSRKDYQHVVGEGDALLGSFGLSDTQKALVRILRAESLACLGNLSEAEIEFVKVENNLTYGYRAIAGRGALQAAQENWEKAEQFFNESLRRFPRNDVALAGLGMCAQSKAKTADAWDFFQKALTLNCENMQALLGCIQLGYQLNRLSEVQANIERYIDYHPVDLSVLYSYAGCLYAQGKHQDATEQLEKITVFEPQHRLAQELLGRIKSEQGSLNSEV